MISDVIIYVLYCLCLDKFISDKISLVKFSEANTYGLRTHMNDINCYQYIE